MSFPTANPLSGAISKLYYEQCQVRGMQKFAEFRLECRHIES